MSDMNISGDDSFEKTGSQRTQDNVHIDDIPPQRTRNFGDLSHAVIALLVAVAVIVISTYMRGITSGVESDAHSAGLILDWLMDVPASMLQQLATIGIVLSVLIHLVFTREWLQTATSIIAMFGGYSAVWGMSVLLTHIQNPMLIASMSSGGVSLGSELLPDMYAGISAFLTVAGPRRVRSSVKWGWNILYGVAVVLVVISWDSVTGVVVSFAIGRLVGMLLRFAIGTRNTGLWGTQVISALHSIGLDVISLQRRFSEKTDSGLLQATLSDDLIENSRLYDAVDADNNRYTVSVLDAQVHIAGYLNQLWQWIRLNGVSMRRDRSASDANHHHQAMILGLRNIGLSTTRVYGVVDSDESSILVFSAEPTVARYSLDTLNDTDAIGLMQYLCKANTRGYTHRRITPDTIGRMDNGEIVIAGWQNGDYASNATNVILDKVQLLTLICMFLGVEHSLALARRVWGDQTLIELTPFIQKAAVPAATRSLVQWRDFGNFAEQEQTADSHAHYRVSGGKLLLNTMRSGIQQLIPDEMNESPETVTLSRFSVRSFLAITLSVIAVAVIFTQLRPDEVISAVRHATPSFALLCLAFSVIAWVGSAITLGVFMDPDKRHYFGLFCSQAAQGFTAVSMPAGVGPAFVNLQYLRKNGYKNTAATAIMSATWAIQGLTTVVLLFVIGIFTGRNTLSGMIPTNTLIVVIGIVALLVCGAMAISPIRRMLSERYLPLVKAYARQLLEVLTQPKELSVGVAGALILNIATGLGFWAALLAFGYHTNPVETTFIFLLANTLGSAVPTPGGLGAVEAALTFAFTSVGVPAAVALSATLLYRVGFYWLRIPAGAVAMKWLDRHNMI